MASEDFASRPAENPASGPVGHILQQARDVAYKMGEAAQSKVRLQLDEQRHGLADGVEHVSEAVSRAAGTLEQKGHATAADYAERASSLLHEYASWLQDKTLDDLAVELGNAVRRRPALLLAGFFALGFLTARFLKSTSSEAATHPDGPARADRA